MRVLGFLLLVATAASARVILEPLPQRSLSSLDASSLQDPRTTTLPPTPKCEFAPNRGSRPSREPSYIPPSAWPSILHILSSQPLIRSRLTSASSSTSNIVQTIDLGHATNDARLEGVMMGLVFTAPRTVEMEDNKQQPLNPGNEGRSRKNLEEEEAVKGEKDLKCLDDAILKVRERKQVEGVMEFESGRLSFLVYRID